MKNLLEASNIVTTFQTDGRTVKAVNGVSIRLQRGEIVGLVGESGSGKSVTAMSILQLILPPGQVEGEVYLEGIKGNLFSYGMKSAQARSVRGGRIGIIFQEPMTSLNPVLTIGYQIQENIREHLKLAKGEARNRALEMLRTVGIPDPESRFNQYPQHFSGGMRQRIMIAMVLAAEPDILIADEATTALDVTMQAQILDLLYDLVKKRNLAIVIVTHNLGLVARYADRIYVLYSGNIVETADKFELFSNPVHPYTNGLLNAVPHLSDRKDRKLTPIEGMPPNPQNRPSWCAFYERCPYREDICKESPCELHAIGENHDIRCQLSIEQLAAKKQRLVATMEKVPQKRLTDEVCLTVTDLCMYFPITHGLLRKRIGEVRAVENVSFTVRKGETLGIVGESGCGKSSLARCIIRAYKPTSGRIEYQGVDLCNVRERELRPLRSRMAMVFQDPFSSLDPRRTARSIVGEALRIHRLTHTRKEYDDRVDELLRMVGLDPTFRDRVPEEFSGGQRQRLGIARALASNPDIIICDEAVSALDVSIQAQVINLLEDLQARLGITYVFIAHDLSVIKHISDTVMVMYLGNVLEVVDCETLYNNPLHPYTQTLLSAVPIADPKVDAQRQRIRLKGEVPSVINRPKGCPFSDRCQYANERCHLAMPALTTMSDGHQIACFLYENQ